MRHYTYVIQNAETERQYIGVRSCECDPQYDEYFGSSKYLDAERAVDPENWTKYIIQEHTTRKAACDDETESIKGIWDQPWCINQNKGSDGWNPNNWSDAAKARHAVALNEAINRPSFKANMSKAQRAKWDKPGYRERISKAVRAALENPEVREKISKASRAAHARPEVKAKHSKARTGRRASPEARAALSKGASARWAKWRIEHGIV